MFKDRYSHIGNEIKKISSQAEIEGFENIHNKIFKSAEFSEVGDIKKIELHHVNKEIRDKCFDLFKVDYVTNKDSYFIETTRDTIKVYSDSKRGALYAIMRIINDDLYEGLIYNYPLTDLRIIKLYLPSKENFSCFKDLIDLCIYYGYNAVMLELGGAMEYSSHPEINEGWKKYSREMSYKINHREENPHFLYKSEDVYFIKNSIHCENGGGGVLSKGDIKELIDYCAERYMEVIPEVPSLSHSDYLLTCHPELAERSEDIYPDTYCPSNPDSYKLLFDILKEIIELFKPKRINIGHDELSSVGLCEKCSLKKAEDIFAEDVIKIYEFLKKRNIKTMMWSDKLLNTINKLGGRSGGARKEVVHPSTGKITEVISPTYKAIDKIPSDIEIFHWYWSIQEDYEDNFISRGFPVYFGNYEALRFKNAVRRFSKNICGYGVSSWGKVDYLHLQRNGIYLNIAFGAMVNWSNEYSEEEPDKNLKCISDDLYNYRIKKAEYKAEIVHTFLKDIKAELYLDGYEADSSKNILGYYIVEYTNGRTEKFPIEYGKTVGYAYVSRERKDSSWCDSYEADTRLAEPSYSCAYEFDEDKIYYRYAIASKTEIKSVYTEVNQEYEGALEIKEIINE